MSALRFTLQHRLFIIEHYFHSRSYDCARTMFQRTFASVLIPADWIIKRIIDKFRFAYTVSDLKQSGRLHVLTDEKRTALCEQMVEELSQQNKMNILNSEIFTCVTFG